MKRLFIALQIPEPVGNRLAALQGGVPGARWVEPENFHLTLRFIGAADDIVEQDVVDAVSGLRFPCFDLSLVGLGHFGSKGRVRTIWAGVEAPPALEELWRKVEQMVLSAGVEPAGRRFKPHVTLARFKDAPTEWIGQYLAMHGLFRSEPFTVASVTLFESRLGHGGPVYRRELEVPLDPTTVVVPRAS